MVGESIVTTVNGVEFSFDEIVYAEFFELPTEGHTFDLILSSEVMEEMKKTFSTDGSMIHVNGNKKVLKPHFILLNDVVAKALQGKSGSFHLYSQDRFDYMCAISKGIQANKESITYAAQLSRLMEHLEVPVGEPEKINSPRVISALTVASTLIRMKNNLECASGASSYQTGGKPSTRSKQPSASIMSIGAKRSKIVNESEAISSSLKSSTKKDSESEKKTKAPRASKSLKVTSSKSLAVVPEFDVPIVEQDESIFSPLIESAKGPAVESAGPNDKNTDRIESHVVQTNQVVAGATELSQLEQGAVLTLVVGKSTEQESSVPAPKDSMVVEKVIRVELSAELCKKPQSAFEFMHSARMSSGIVISEPRPAAKPVEVVGKGKKIATPVLEEVSEATSIVDLILDQVKVIAAEKLEIFESWSLERLLSKYNETLSNSAITREWKKRVANEKKVLKWAKTSEVAEALKRKDLVEARKANFNLVEKGSEVEVRVLKRLNDIMDSYVSVATRYVHGANCSGAKPFDDDEAMDILDADNDANELYAALLIEFGNLSTEETEEAQEKVAVVTQPEIIRSEGEPSKDKNAEEGSSSSEDKQDQYARHRAEEELLEEEHNETAKVAEKEQLEKSMQIHTNFKPIQSMEAESQENSSNKESSTEGNNMLKSMKFVLSSLQKSMENAKSNAQRDKPRITQGESSRRSDGVSTGTRSRRAPRNDDNHRPTKRGGGLSGGDRGGRSSGGGRGRLSGYDQRGRASGGDRGGRSSGSNHGGRSFPPCRGNDPTSI
ncbi:uncharacterized protein LOC124943368 [Impatiens glandulifera]|uniref:uncharacterized protein LOC124943368 n=1 Tax=Impatiens glandulifera TaxID=253017 RepID=UPI001FB0F34D|nr:uncharacterized protein LOC124943368 [Impatiens glandulifera]